MAHPVGAGLGALVLSGALAVAGLAGCGSGDDAADGRAAVSARGEVVGTGDVVAPSTTAPIAGSTAASAAVPALPASPGGAPARLRAEVLETRPHDPTAFTQGLELVEGRLYESTGLYGRSSLRELDPVTGEVLRQVALDAGLFGEGLTAVGDRLVQLTWREGVALVWDRDTFEPLAEVAIAGEGWGLCHDRGAGRLVHSDGSATLTFRDPDGLEVIGTVPVTEDGAPVARLNELDCDEETGLVWANVWQTDEIVGVDPATGVVAARVDASRLRPGGRGVEEVLNGIAALGEGRYLLTGKNWPHAFVVRFVAA